MSTSYDRNKALFDELDRIKAAGVKNPVIKEMDDRTAMAVRFKEAAKEIEKKTKVPQNEVMEDIYRTVVIDSRNDFTGKLPEALFTEYFLPVFKQTPEEIEKLTQQERAIRDQLLQDWVKVAGGVFNEVNIIDQAGNILFTVPALKSTAVINPKKNENHPGFSHVVATARLMEFQSPTKSLEYQKKEFTKTLLSQVEKKGVYKTDEERWIDIFNRYGGMKSEQSTSTSNTNTTSNNEFDDEIVYD